MVLRRTPEDDSLTKKFYKLFDKLPFEVKKYYNYYFILIKK